MAKKLSSYKRLKYLPKNTLQTIYFSSIVPTVTYCNLAWGTCSPNLLNEIEHIHLRAAKIIYNLSDNLTDNEILTATKWQPITHTYKRKLMILMHNIYNNQAPEILSNLFNKNTSCKYNLRRNNSYIIPRHNLQVGRTTLRFRGPVAWNSLSNEIKKIDKLSKFKSVLKKSRKVLDDLTFHKETCLVNNKDADYCYN